MDAKLLYLFIFGFILAQINCVIVDVRKVYSYIDNGRYRDEDTVQLCSPQWMRKLYFSVCRHQSKRAHYASNEEESNYDDLYDADNFPEYAEDPSFELAQGVKNKRKINDECCHNVCTIGNVKLYCP